MKYASIGTISHGTLREEDLLETFANELEYQVQYHSNAPCGSENEGYMTLIWNARELDLENEEQQATASDLITELMDALNEFAPPYCYFGSLEGDGSDFGYWPDMNQLEELPRVENSDEAKALGEDAMFVNDHGNVTVYGGDGSVIFECV